MKPEDMSAGQFERATAHVAQSGSGRTLLRAAMRIDATERDLHELVVAYDRVPARVLDGAGE